MKFIIFVLSILAGMKLISKLVISLELKNQYTVFILYNGLWLALVELLSYMVYGNGASWVLVGLWILGCILWFWGQLENSN